MNQTAYRRRLVGLGLILVSLLLLGIAAGTAVLAMSNTSTLSNRVETSEKLGQANIRTLTQTQRELMKLELLLVANTDDAEDIQLQKELVSQRVLSAADDYSPFLLGSKALFIQAESNRETWRLEIQPRIDNWQRRAPGWEADRRQALRKVRALELNYNDIVNFSESNRSEQSAQANQAAKDQVQRVRMLVFGVVGVFIGAVLIFFIGAQMIRRLMRERAAANTRLSRANEDLAEAGDILQATNTMALVVDELGLITWVNESFKTVWGYREDEIIGRRPADLLGGPDSSVWVQTALRKAIKGGTALSAENAYYTKDGVRHWVNLQGNPLATVGSRRKFVIVGTDITERKEAERLLERARRDAEETARQKTGFLATMSHEIRTPLNAVLGLTDLLRITHLDDEQRDYADSAHRSGQHLLAILNDVLDFSALESGEISLEHTPFSLSKVVDDSLGMFAGAARSQGLDLSGTVDPKLPALVDGDRVRLQQVLVNLIGNAVKFTQVGKVWVEVEAVEPPSDSQDDVLIRFRVSDTGIGIDPAQASKLFQPFQRGDVSTTRRFGGTGLGLAICRQITEAMGGSIAIVPQTSSAAGNAPGAVIEAEIPFARAAELSRVRLLDHDSPDTVDTEMARVLVVEDDPVNKTVIVHMLRRFGIEATVVDNGWAAVRVVTDDVFDLVLLDLQMPEMDGFEAARLMREMVIEPRPYIVAVTADASIESRERFAEVGIDDYLGKPLSLDSLERLLKRAPFGAQARRVDRTASLGTMTTSRDRPATS